MRFSGENVTTCFQRFEAKHSFFRAQSRPRAAKSLPLNTYEIARGKLTMTGAHAQTSSQLKPHQPGSRRATCVHNKGSCVTVAKRWFCRSPTPCALSRGIKAAASTRYRISINSQAAAPARQPTLCTPKPCSAVRLVCLSRRR